MYILIKTNDSLIGANSRLSWSNVLGIVFYILDTKDGSVDSLLGSQVHDLYLRKIPVEGLIYEKYNLYINPQRVGIASFSTGGLFMPSFMGFMQYKANETSHIIKVASKTHTVEKQNGCLFYDKQNLGKAGLFFESGSAYKQGFLYFFRYNDCFVGKFGIRFARVSQSLFVVTFVWSSDGDLLLVSCPELAKEPAIFKEHGNRKQFEELFWLNY